MKRPYQITGVVLILLAVFVYREAVDLKYYQRTGPGPGFFPTWDSILIGLLGIIMFVQATFKNRDPLPRGFFPTRAGYLRVGAIVLGVGASALLLNPLGYPFTMLAFLLFMLFALGRQNPLVAITVALLGSFGVYYAFVNWLNVPLPPGILGG